MVAPRSGNDSGLALWLGDEEGARGARGWRQEQEGRHGEGLR
jgi:hypothetical protein